MSSTASLQYLDDLLDHIAVIVAHIAGVELHMVSAADCGELQLQLAAGQLDGPWLTLHFELRKQRKGRACVLGRCVPGVVCTEAGRGEAARGMGWVGLGREKEREGNEAQQAGFGPPALLRGVFQAHKMGVTECKPRLVYPGGRCRRVDSLPKAATEKYVTFRRRFTFSTPAP